MNFTLLDGGGAFLLGYLIILFLVAAIVSEAIVMILLKFNKAGKCFLDALLINIASLVAGYLLLDPVQNISDKFGSRLQIFAEILIMFLITLLIEAGLLMLLNKAKNSKQVWLTAFIMNLVSYLILWAFLSF